MATLLECHDALAARLETIPGLRVFNHPPQGGTPPAGFVVFRQWTPQSLGRTGMRQCVFEVYVLTAESARPQDGYQSLMEYADFGGAKSVHAAVWDGNTAGSFAGQARTSAHVAGFRVLGQTQMDELQMYGGVFDVQISTSG